MSALNSLSRAATVAAFLSCVIALSACSETDKGQDNAPLNMGAGVGGGGGFGGAGGESGAAASGGVGASGAGGMGATAGASGAGGEVTAGVGGAAGDVAAGMGGAAGDVVAGMGGETAGVGGEGGAGGMSGEGGTTGGMGGEGGTTGGMGGEGGAPLDDKGVGDGSDVITIGDSWMRLNPTEGIEISLERVSGRDYRNYAVAGTMILDGAIPRQFSNAVRENPNIKTVVMTGGGNDILIGNIFCTVNWTESCNETVRKVATALGELREDMFDAGVEDVVLIGYDFIPNQEVKPGLELSIMLSQAMCVPDAMPRCHFLNNANTVSGMIRGDGIHPTGAGYDLLGERVWSLMQERGLRR